MADLTLREYNEVQIPQRSDDGYINATKMCQAGGKLWGNFWQLQATQDFVSALALDIGIPISKLVVKVQGRGDVVEQGTWVHPDLAIELARWISPEFAILTNRWAREIIEGRRPVVNEASHEGAITRGIAALMESNAALHKTMQTLAINSTETNKRVDIVIGEVKELKNDFSKLDEKVDRIDGKRRRDPSLRTQRILKAVVWRYYGGCCPIARHIKIMESDNVRIKVHNRSISQWDHWYGRHENDVREMWLLSEEMHKLFEADARNRDKYYSTFQEFQRHVAIYIEETEGVQPELFPTSIVALP